MCRSLANEEVATKHSLPAGTGTVTEEHYHPTSSGTVSYFIALYDSLVQKIQMDLERSDGPYFQRICTSI